MKASTGGDRSAMVPHSDGPAPKNPEEDFGVVLGLRSVGSSLRCVGRNSAYASTPRKLRPAPRSASRFRSSNWSGDPALKSPDHGAFAFQRSPSFSL
jgi:hypothetical protein